MQKGAEVVDMFSLHSIRGRKDYIGPSCRDLSSVSTSPWEEDRKEVMITIQMVGHGVATFNMTITNDKRMTAQEAHRVGHGMLSLMLTDYYGIWGRDLGSGFTGKY